VIAVDTNILVYAHREESPYHLAAERRVRELSEGAAAWAIPWPCVHEFLAVVTRGRGYQPPTPLPVALDQVEAWLGSPSVSLLSESEEYWPALKAIVSGGQITGGRIHDARIAAICLHHRVHELWSADRDFSRFPGLKTVNPLI
jgi:toxin-antitoxin system PIN domain toxin